MGKHNVIILGAAGRDFHNFLNCFKDNPAYRVVAFTAAQIPGIEKRVFPKELAGRLYKNDIPIYSEEDLPKIVKKHKADIIHLAYSDLSHEEVMQKASLANSLGCDFLLLSPESTMIKPKKPVIAVTAVRTGCGKSQTTRHIAEILKFYRKKAVVIRHPMPYSQDLKSQIVQRFETHEDLKKHNVTIEEAEEYEPLIEKGYVVFAGVDYKKILEEAEKEADIIIFDGGNNDTSFFRPDLWIVLTDPHRPGHEVSYYPGFINLLSADVAIINKENTALKKSIETVRANIKKHNPKAVIVDAFSTITVNKPELIRNKKVLVVEDGPTLTHGGMPYGAGTIAAKRYGARIIDPHPYLKGSLKKVFQEYPHLGGVLPAMGYGERQVRELEVVINRTPCDAVISGTPIDLRNVLRIKKPVVRIRYELVEKGRPDLEHILRKFVARMR